VSLLRIKLPVQLIRNLQFSTAHIELALLNGTWAHIIGPPIWLRIQLQAQLLRNLPFSTVDIALALLDITWASNHRAAEFVENKIAGATIRKLAIFNHGYSICFSDDYMGIKT
jgi:hypothetical protein